MPLVKTIRKRGVNMVVEANAEILFTAGGPVGSFTRSFSNKIRGFTIQAAPSNKRPRWGHYGPPLKRTIKASTKYSPATLRTYAAVGSTAPHAGYVDQGTGVYNGGGPYEAKILPPTAHGAPNLYESTWRVPGGRNRAGKVLIKGQRGQHFFDAGLRAGFAAMGIPSVEVPGGGGASMSDALATVPNALENFLGNTVADAGFRASLAEWRAWRDAAFRTRKRQRPSRSRGLNRRSTPEKRKADAAARARKRRASVRQRERDRPSVPTRTYSQRKNDALARWKESARRRGITLEVDGFDDAQHRWIGSYATKDERGRTIYRESKSAVVKS